MSKPPSRRRYEAENPTVSFRISKEAKRELELLVEDPDQSKKDWFEALIADERGRYSVIFEQGHTKGKKRGYEDGYDEGYEEGRKDAYQEYVPVVPCEDCGEPVAINTEEQRETLYNTIKQLHAEWSALPPPGQLAPDIRQDECPSP
jgi:flagellar biosynthesis/type III secretory pathway protein FliH